MGPRDLLVLLVVALVYGLPVLWVLFSSRSRGGAKFGWFLVAMFFSWLGLAVFLIVTQHPRERR
jgi:RsiW-degrading membrane proteinase PrsW (M82 family)